MGITRNTAEFLLQCRADGVVFGNTLTIGRQNLFIDQPELDRLTTRYGYKAGALRSYYAQTWFPWADPLLELIGATCVDSMDVSNYEGATILHDLNDPISSDLHERFDCVIDAGSLEHVFHFPTAIKSCMEMVKVGGHLILITPANNFFGHGFYQFSPELFYRALSRENGYVVKRAVALEEETAIRSIGDKKRVFVQGSRWHCVRDPMDLGRRTGLINKRKVTLFIQAERIAAMPIFAQTPQQSDYTVLWERHASPPARSAKRPKSGLARSLARFRFRIPKPAFLLFLKQRRAASWRDQKAFPADTHTRR